VSNLRAQYFVNEIKIGALKILAKNGGFNLVFY
jgi:hypothetical protein